jgi:hypothetical protein
MKKPTPILVLLILSAIIYLVSKNKQSSSAQSSPESSITFRKNSTRLPRLTPQNALKKICELRAQTPDSSTTFASVQALVHKLSDDNLQSLLRDIGLAKTPGYDAWLRSALFPEWASRDLQAVVDYIRSPIKGGSTYDSSLQQAYFAIFQGSRPHEPEAALEHLHTLRSKHELGKYGSGSNWIEHIHLNLFQELSKIDPGKAWELLPKPSTPDQARPIRSLQSIKIHRAAIEGLFSGLPNNDLISQFADRWIETYSTPNDEVPNREFVISKFTEHIPKYNLDLTTIASIWMNSDPSAALAWLQSREPANPSLAKNGASRAFSDWAYCNPREALSTLQNDRFPEYSGPIATNLLRANAHLAPDLGSIKSPSFSLHDAIVGSMPLNAMHEGPAQYPDPNKNNRPPDYQARFDSFSIAIQSPNIFNEKIRNQLLDSLDRNFESILNP